MNRQLTLKEYRTIDLILFALILAVFEFLIVRFANHTTFGTVSLAALVTAIIYMRWGWWGGIHAVLAGVLFCFYLSICGVRTAEATDYVVYIVGNLFSLAAPALLKKIGPERVWKSSFNSTFFFLAVILLMQGGRMVMAVALKGAEWNIALAYITGDALSILFTLVIGWIVRRLDGVFEEQVHYLTRVQEERERNNTER